MSDARVSRREFVQDAAAIAAGTALAASAAEAKAAQTQTPDPRKTRNYHENMEYRRLGRTNLMLSAVSMGGHWKQIPFAPGSEEFKANRREVLAAALEHGINYIDACSSGEVLAYAEALKGKRDRIYFGFDWHGGRDPNLAGSLEKMKQQLDEGLQKAGLDYVDVWRVTMREQGTKNTEREIETVAEALAWGKKTGKARATGISTHHRPWIAEIVARYPSLEVIVTPYSAGSKEKPRGSMFEALRRYGVGLIGIKPFASGTVFKSRGKPDSETKAEDDQRARLCLRHVLSCDALTAAIPGLITVEQVANAAAAVKERRQLDLAESTRLHQIVEETWANLPREYRWLRNWEWV